MTIKGPDFLGLFSWNVGGWGTGSKIRNFEVKIQFILFMATLTILTIYFCQISQQMICPNTPTYISYYQTILVFEGAFCLVWTGYKHTRKLVSNKVRPPGSKLRLCLYHHRRRRRTRFLFINLSSSLWVLSVKDCMGCTSIIQRNNKKYLIFVTDAKRQ